MRTTACLLGCTVLAIAFPVAAQTLHPEIPKAWDDKEVERFELPLAQRDRSPRYMTAEEYYKLKVRPIYRSYPAYAKGREPAGYLESLKEKDPEIIFDAAKLHTKEDWIQAGKLVFESEIRFFPAPATQPAVEDVPWPVSSGGVLPFFRFGYRYFVRKRGVVEAGVNSCAGCHTRVMADGSLFLGGQGSQPPITPARIRSARDATPDSFRRTLNNEWINFGAPWVMSREAFEASFTKDEYIRRLAARRSSVFARQGASSTCNGSRSFPA